MNTKPKTHVIDPICGMRISVNGAADSYTFIGVTYYFCSVECGEVFKRAPERHVVYLAHEPGNEHYGYCCPAQRRLRSRHGANHLP